MTKILSPGSSRFILTSLSDDVVTVAATNLCRHRALRNRKTTRKTATATVIQIGAAAAGAESDEVRAPKTTKKRRATAVEPDCDAQLRGKTGSFNKAAH